jgi:hypothetical protein
MLGAEPQRAQVGVVLCACATLLFTLVRTNYAQASYVTASAMFAVALCQYTGCCGHTGSLRYALERMVGARRVAVFCSDVSM